MKRTIYSVLTGIIASLCLTCASVSAEIDKPIKIFLLGGQSNMAGQLKEYWAEVQSPYKDPFPQIQLWHNKRNQWGPLAPTHRLGPEIGFGHAIANALPNDEIRLVKYASNGTALYNDWAPIDGPQYLGFMQAAQGALADLDAKQLPYEIAGMLWLQGESDAVETMGAEYEKNLAAFIEHMRSIFNTPEMPFIIARVRDFYGKGEQAQMVRTAQQALAEQMPNVTWFDTDDLNPLVNGGHYDLAGTLEIGNRFAEAYMETVSVFETELAPGYEQLTQKLKITDNTAAHPSPRVPVNQRWLDAHAKRQQTLDAHKGKFEYFVVGDSITAGWSRSGKEEFNKLFDIGKVMNLGHPGDKTQNILWRLMNHNFNQSNPKVVMVLAGTNNSNNDEWTEEQIAEGVQAIVQMLRAKLPETKLLLLGILPRGSRDQRINLTSGLTEAVMNPQWEKIDRVNQIIETFADGTNVVYLNINQAFLNENGALPCDVMPDLLHPNEKGYKIWANAVRPTLEKMTAENTK